MTPLRWLVAIMCVLGILALVLLHAITARADPDMHAEGHEWFLGKKTPGGNSCCNNRDCRVLEMDRWSITAEGFTVEWEDGRTYSMPLAQVQPTEDRQGRAAGCVVNQRLICGFMPLSY